MSASSNQAITTSLTENQTNVIEAISNGSNTTELLIEKLNLSKSSLTPILNSLLKKGLIVKNDDSTFSAAIVEQKEEKTESIKDESINELIETQDSGYSIPLIIPYLKSEAAGEELKFALRSWEQNFKEKLRVIIIGDKEGWFSPEIIYIPHMPHLVKEVCGCPNPSLIRNPQADVSHKVFSALVAENIEGGFILSNDDIFLLGETTLADIEVLKAFVNDLEQTGKGKGLYAENNRLTAKVLKAENLPIVRYGTHTPMAFHAEKLIDIIEKYDATEHGYALASLFYNEVFPNARPILIDGGANDPILASAYRSDINYDVLKKVFATRKFLNCDAKGWLSVEKILKETFPNPSRFEL